MRRSMPISANRMTSGGYATVLISMPLQRGMGLKLAEILDMPANNTTLVFERG